MTPPSPDQQELYGAYSHCYATEANRRRTAFMVDLVLTALGATIAVLTVADEAESLADLLSTWMPPAALLWLVVRESNVLGDDTERRHKAVTIQEQFDLTFWRPDDWKDQWNHILCGPPVRPREIKELALCFQGEPVADDYWVDTTDIHPEAAALLRIKQSAAWGAKGHLRYARLNRAAAWVGLVIVLAFAFIADLGTREASGVLMAVAPILTGRLQSSRSHFALSDRRAALEDHLETLFGNAIAPKDRDVRLAQDELFRMRLEGRRIPSWLYLRYVDQDRKAIDEALDDEVQRLRSEPRKGRT